MKNRLFFSFVALALILSSAGLSLNAPEAQAQFNGTLQAQPSEVTQLKIAAPQAETASLQLNNELIAPPPGGDPPTPDPNPGVSLDLADPATLTDCTDGLDNDEDGKEDRDDKGCYTNPYWGEYDPKDTDEVSCTDPNFPDWIYDSDPPYNGDWIRTGGSCNEHWESCAQIEAAGFEDPLPKKCLQPPPDLDGPKCYDDEGDQVECGPGPDIPDGPGGLTNPYVPPNPHPHFTINAPQENELMDKDETYTVSGECTEGYHVFISANNTKNPAYVECSNAGTYEISGLKWLASVKAGSSQLISGEQVDMEGKFGGNDEVTVKILQEMEICIDCLNDKPACSDEADNDNDGKLDSEDPGCWIDPTDPGTYDPNDPDEENPNLPQCRDGKDNEDQEDDKADANDPGCWLDPNDPGTYDPNDPDEEDEPTDKPECSDGIDNDDQEDNLPDDQDPGCKHNGQFDPNDPDESDDCVPSEVDDCLPDDDCVPNEVEGCFTLTIDDPENEAVVKKDDIFTISGKCDPGYDVFLTQQTQKNPAYALCSPQGTYVAEDLKWLDSVEKGSKQPIVAYELDEDDNKFGPVNIVVNIAKDDEPADCVPNEVDDCLPDNDKPECSDGIDNNDDEDNLPDDQDPGCFHDGQFDPNDPDENDEPTDKPECSDGINNDDDNVIDANDPGCWLDPNDPGTYDPNDPDEEDKPTDKPQCSDGIDNVDDEDNLSDANDPGCKHNGQYDPNDPDENDEPTDKPECSDDLDNDHDGKIDEKDPACHTDNDPDNPGSYNPGDDDEGDEPECSDDKDNDNDGKTDEKDPNCHTDGNPDNPGSYDPGDNDEGEPNDKPMCSDKINNDDDGLIDAADPGCWKDPADPDSYDPNDNDEGNDQCLDYNALRKLVFDDIKDLDQVGARAAIALKNTRLLVNGKVSQYILSGYGGDLDETGHTLVEPNNALQRIEGAKIFLISHCLPILDEDTIPNVRVNGEPMVSYHDLPRSGSAPSTLVQDIAYTVQRFTGSEDSIMRGTDEGNFEPWRVFQIQEFMKPLMMVQEYRSGVEFGKDYQSVNAVSNLWSYEYYARAADQGLLQYIPNALTKPTQPILRKYAFDALVHAMLQRDLYESEDETAVKKVLNE